MTQTYLQVAYKDTLKTENKVIKKNCLILISLSQRTFKEILLRTLIPGTDQAFHKQQFGSCFYYRFLFIVALFYNPFPRFPPLLVLS